MTPPSLQREFVSLTQPNIAMFTPDEISLIKAGRRRLCGRSSFDGSTRGSRSGTSRRSPYRQARRKFSSDRRISGSSSQYLNSRSSRWICGPRTRSAGNISANCIYGRLMDGCMGDPLMGMNRPACSPASRTCTGSLCVQTKRRRAQTSSRTCCIRL